MRKILLTLLLGITMLISACAPAEEIKYSENILFSVDYGGAGYGTRADCADAEIYVCTDRTIRISMINSDYTEIIEIGQLDISEENYEKLRELSQPEKITALTVKERMDVCDGTSCYITLYGEDDAEIFRVGGYMPDGKAFQETRSKIIEILRECGISDIIEAHRETLE